MLSNITLNFYNELVKVEVPKNLSALRTQISKSFLFSPNDAEEVILTFVDNGEQILIQNDKDYKAFLSSNTDIINLSISQNSQIYQKSLNKINEESQDKKKLETLLNRKRELDDMKQKNEILENRQISELKNRIRELQKRKHLLKRKLFEENKKLNQEKYEVEKEIVNLQKKLKLEVTVKPQNDFKKYPTFIPFLHAPPRNLPFMRGPHYQHHLRCHMKPCEEKAKKEFLFNKTMPKLKNFINLNKELEIHHFVQCDGCEMAPLRGKRYKCKECENFDYCENCYNKNKQSHKHEFEIIEKSEFPYPPVSKDEKGLEIHYGIICDGCEMNPLKGKRYKCKKCEDFDYCEKCYEKNKNEHKHEFELIEKKECCNMKNDFPRNHHNYHIFKNIKKEESLPIHKGVECDGCGVYPIVGCRYKCGVCGDFDYCEECEKKLGEKHGHPFIKICKPEITPNYIRIETNKNQ